MSEVPDSSTTMKDNPMTTETKTCKPIQETIDIRVEITPNYQYGWNRMSVEDRHAWLHRWASEIREFFRDHRSMDVNAVTVEPVQETVCSACKHGWEEAVDDDTGEKACAYCGTVCEK